MDVTRREFEDLVGAYALDAVDPDEAAAIERYLDGDPRAAAEAGRLRAAAAWIRVAGALEPPPLLRERLLAATRTDPASPRDCFLDVTGRFGDLAARLTDDELARPTHNGLRVRELIAHLAALDEAFASEVRAPRRTFIGAEHVAQITARALPAVARFGRDELVAHWRACRDDLVAAVDAAPPGTAAAGYPVADVLVIRAFEAWTHADDIRAATGRPLEVPRPAVLRTMAELAMRSLPLALAVANRARPGATARIVLTGAGGGTWTVPCAPGVDPARAAPAVELRASVVDWCRRFADRLTEGELVYDATGDVDLARDLVAAAPAFAGL